MYEHVVLQPILLCHLKDSCALLLPLGELGTLWHLTNAIIAIGANEKEKEVIAAQMCIEVSLYGYNTVYLIM